MLAVILRSWLKAVLTVVYLSAYRRHLVYIKFNYPFMSAPGLYLNHISFLSTAEKYDLSLQHGHDPQKSAICIKIIRDTKWCRWSADTLLMTNSWWYVKIIITSYVWDIV